MLNVVARLQQRCGNVLITSETDVGTTIIFDHDNINNDVVATLPPRRRASWVIN